MYTRTHMYTHMYTHTHTHTRTHTHTLFHRSYRSRFENEETTLFCMRVMVGATILFDHIHPVGAFAKKASIDVSHAAHVHLLGVVKIAFDCMSVTINLEHAI